MPKARPLPPTGAKPLAELPFFALRRVNGGHFDPVVRQLYAAVKEAGGRPAGKGKDGYQFRIGTVEASVNLSTGLAKISAPPVKKRVRNRRSRRKALPGRETAPFEPDFDIDPVLRHEDLVWTIEALPESGVNGGRIPGHRGGVKAGHWRWGAADMARAPIGALAISAVGIDQGMISPVSGSALSGVAWFCSAAAVARRRPADCLRR